MNTSRILGSLLLSAVALAAHAQAPKAASSVLVSEPGRAMAAETVNVKAVVTAIDPATRKLTLKGPDGKSVDLVAGNEVKNFAQIKVNDEVVVQYVRALSLELRKKGAETRENSMTGTATRAEPGQKPGAATGVRVVVVADVVAVNPGEKTISLRGPKGNVVDLAVNNPEQFKVVQVGDKVEAEYVEALAVKVRTPAKKK
jgi:hypothetical protein